MPQACKKGSSLSDHETLINDMSTAAPVQTGTAVTVSHKQATSIRMIQNAIQNDHDQEQSRMRPAIRHTTSGRQYAKL